MKKTIVIIMIIGIFSGCAREDKLNNDFIADETNHKCEIKAP
jgi:hypothetical protein